MRTCGGLHRYHAMHGHDGGKFGDRQTACRKNEKAFWGYLFSQEIGRMGTILSALCSKAACDSLNGVLQGSLMPQYCLILSQNRC